MAAYITATLDDGSKHILYPSEAFDILIDVATVDNGEIGEVISDLSQSFQFHGTEENNRFFQHAFDFGFQDIPGVNKSVEVTVDTDVETLFFGTMSLDRWEESSGTYVCSIASGTVPLEESLGDQLMSDADWGATHPYNMQTWLDTNNLQSNTYMNFDYFYPMVDNGHDSDGRTMVPSDEVLRSSASVITNTVAGGDADAYGRRLDGNESSFYTGDSGITTTTTIQSNSPYFGQVASGDQLQGYITHPSTPLRIEQLSPAVRLSTVIDRIFSLTGDTPNTYEAAFLDDLTDVFVYPRVQDKEGVLGLGGNTTDGIILEENDPPIEEIAKGTSGGTDSHTLLQWTFGQTGNYQQNIDSGGNVNGGFYTVPISGTYTFNFSGSFEIVTETQSGSQFNDHQARIVMVRNGVRTSLGNHQLDRIFGDRRFAPEDLGWDFEYTGNFTMGDRIGADFVSVRHKGNDSIRGLFKDLRFRTSEIPRVWSDGAVDLGDQFGDTSAKDMLAGILQKFNLVIYPDKNRRNHYIIQQYYDSVLTGVRRDWSDKVDISTMTFSNLLQGQDNTVMFKDAESDDRINKAITDVNEDLTYGQVDFVSEDDGITTGDKVVGDFFAPTIPARPRIAGDITNGISPSSRNGIPHLYELDGEEANLVESGIRLGYGTITAPLDKFYYELGTTSRDYQGRVRTLSSVNQAGTRDLNYSNNYNFSDTSTLDAYTLYWKDYIDHLYSGNNVLATVDVLLTPSEYKQIGFNDVIHINGVDYLIKEVSGWNLTREDVSTLSLISYRNNFSSVFEEPTLTYAAPTDPDLRTNTLGIQLIGYDGLPGDGILFENPVVQLNGTNPVSIVGEGAGTAEGGVATSFTFTRKILPLEGFEISASNFTSNSATLPGITASFVDDGGTGVDMNVTQTVQDNNLHQLLIVEGEVDVEIAGNTDFGINFSLVQSLTDEQVGIQDLGDGRGSIGGTGVLQATINPPAGETLDVNTFSVVGALPLGVLGVTFSVFGTSILATARVEFQAVDTSVSIQITGSDPTQLPAGTQTSLLTIDFTETIENVSTISDLSFRGVVGTGSILQVPLYAADGFQVNVGTFSATLTDEVGMVPSYATMQTAVGGGESVQIPITITQWQAADTTLNVLLNGAATSISSDVPKVNIRLQTLGAPAGSVLTDTDETFTVDAGTDFQYVNTLNPTQGNQLTGTTTVSETSDEDGVVSNLSINGNKFGANISMMISAGTEDASATITLDASVVGEPYLYTANITESLPLGKLSTPSPSVRFGDADLSVDLIGVTIRPLDDTNHSYLDGTTFTVSGGTASNYSYAGGSVTFDIEVSFVGRFSDTVPRGSFTTDISIDSPAAVLQQASAGSGFSQNRFEIPLGVARTIDTTVVANGQWRVRSTGAIAFPVNSNGNIADSTTSTMGMVSLAIPAQSEVNAGFSICRLESFDGATIVGSIVVEITNAASIEELGAVVAQELIIYDLFASTAFDTRFGYTALSGAGRTINIPAGDSAEVLSITEPEVLEGGGSGIRIESRGVAAENANTVGGIAIVIGAPTSGATNTLFFN